MLNYQYSELSEKIINAFYTVYNTLGYGFLEKVYENALLIELKKKGLNVVSQHGIEVFYDEEKVGLYFADLLVENLIIIELKTCEEIIEAHQAQLTNYLRATTIEVGLILNFGRNPQIKRRVFDNSRKLF